MKNSKEKDNLFLKRNLALLHWKYSGALTVPACTFRLSAEIYPEIEIYLQPIFTAKKQKAKSWSCVTWVIVHQRVRNDQQTKRLKMSTGKTFKLPIPEKSSKLFKIRFINFWNQHSPKCYLHICQMKSDLPTRPLFKDPPYWCISWALVRRMVSWLARPPRVQGCGKSRVCLLMDLWKFMVGRRAPGGRLAES